MAIYLDASLLNKQCECPRCVLEREAWVIYLAEQAVKA
jgi:hypothetical protein